MEHEGHQWRVHTHEEQEEEEEMMEDDALIRKHSVSHIKGGLITDEVTFSSSCCSSSSGSEHNNVVFSVFTAPDGSLVHKEEEVAEIGDGGEDSNHVNGDKVDYEAVGLAQVAGFDGVATNGEVVGGVAVSQNQNSVYFDEQRDDEVNGLNGVQNDDAFGSVHPSDPTNLGEREFDVQKDQPVIQNSLCSKITDQCMKTVDDRLPYIPELSHIYNSSDIQASAVANFHEETSTKEAPNLIDQKLEEFDVEAVLAKQETHDLFCPNCHSCITKRVILKKRKRYLQKSDNKAKRDKLETVGSSELEDSSAQPEGNQGDHANVTSESAIVGPELEECTKEAPNLIDQKLEEFDVEAVLAKQETHDLFCPNCHSCITKRVILKKRKRYLQKSDNKAKRDKLETVGSSELEDSSAQPEGNQGDHANVTSESAIVGPEPPADNNQSCGEPELFRCLSCFSFFIPRGKCFELFRNFGGANKNEGAQNPSSVPPSNLQNSSNPPASNVQNPSNPQGSNANWLKYLFTLNKGEKASDASLQHSGTGSAEQHNSAPITSDELTYPEIGHPKGPLADTSVIKNVKNTSEINRGHEGINSLIISTNLSPIQSCTKSDNDLVNEVQREGQDFLDFSLKEQLPGKPMIHEVEKKNASADITKTGDNAEDMSSMSISNEKVYKYESVPSAAAATTTETIVKAEETAKDTILKHYEGEPEFPVSTTVGFLNLEESVNDVDNKLEVVKNNYSSLVHKATSPIQSSGSEILADGAASIKQNSGRDVIFPSKLDFTQIDSSTRKQNSGAEVIVVVEREAVKSTTSQTADNMPAEGATITGSQTRVQIDEQPSSEVGEPQGWEILKSIVYGGLAEAITSLGIVSSAVSSGATPLNIIALGFANLIGGLFILGHNLIDLKNDHTEGDQAQTNVQDRYQEQLGRRANFLLHAVVAVLSFLIFGAVPLVIYGVLINKNYYTDVKLAAVAASSIVCIILLAIGKVYTRKPPKSYVKTILYYVTLALAASGVSYIGGNLIKDLLEKLNHPESGFAITMPLSDTSKGSTWSSY
ncbi:hypothetical protein Fmac_031429 [Flemingia macrophylla]|uniref:Membrane protein of ER body-like protein n=1 Tax=Flemingia macrophylla TaxID=520843 RepID=A0ABD1L2G3_9FABA